MLLPHIRRCVADAGIEATEVIEMIEMKADAGYQHGDQVLDQTLTQMHLSALLAFITRDVGDGNEGAFQSELHEQVERLRQGLPWDAVLVWGRLDQARHAHVPQAFSITHWSMVFVNSCICRYMDVHGVTFGGTWIRKTPDNIYSKYLILIALCSEKIGWYWGRMHRPSECTSLPIWQCRSWQVSPKVIGARKLNIAIK